MGSALLAEALALVDLDLVELVLKFGLVYGDVGFYARRNLSLFLLTLCKAGFERFNVNRHDVFCNMIQRLVFVIQWRDVAVLQRFEVNPGANDFAGGREGLMLRNGLLVLTFQ
uniref:Putative secreted protein n=1 Tax=Ixodes ricinus TaxID=34613 RepID=A0A6B0UKC5_IXORI